MNQTIRSLIEEFTKESPSICLSTISEDGNPHAALIYFALNEALEICFFAPQNTQKSQNILKNPKVAMVLQDVAGQKSLQMNGVATKIEDVEENRTTFNLLVKALSGKVDWPPPAGKIESGEMNLFKIQITWARLGDFRGHDEEHFRVLIG